jgi:glycine reductase
MSEGTKIRVVHYLNQFFGQLGGEEQAGVGFTTKQGPVGPGIAFQEALGEVAEIVGTIICGDDHFAANSCAGQEEAKKLIEAFDPDLVIAGPAFNAGRYGVACGAVCEAALEQLSIPAVTGMYEENPGVELYSKNAYIVRTKDSAAGMREAVASMTRLGLKLARSEAIGLPEDEGYLPRGLRVNIQRSEKGSKRAVDMLLAKLSGEPFTTEYPMPVFDRIAPLPPVVDLSAVRVALVTSGGIVPTGNPDRIEASNATKFGRYCIEGVVDLTPDTFQSVHGGYDTRYANEDPDRVLPVDILRSLEAEGVIGELYNSYYATVGNGTAVKNAKGFGEAIAKELLENDVGAVLLVST